MFLSCLVLSDCQALTPHLSCHLSCHLTSPVLSPALSPHLFCHLSCHLPCPLSCHMSCHLPCQLICPVTCPVLSPDSYCRAEGRRAGCCLRVTVPSIIITSIEFIDLLSQPFSPSVLLILSLPHLQYLYPFDSFSSILN